MSSVGQITKYLKDKFETGREKEGWCGILGNKLAKIGNLVAHCV
jgi:hypothetical protein